MSGNTRAPFAQILPCPQCGVVTDKNHDVLKHINPTLGIRSGVFDILVERAKKACANSLSREEVLAAFVEREGVPFCHAEMALRRVFIS